MIKSVTGALALIAALVACSPPTAAECKAEVKVAYAEIKTTGKQTTMPDCRGLDQATKDRIGQEVGAEFQEGR